MVNNGVLAKLENPYFEGNPIAQIQQCAHAAGIEIDFRLGAIYIWPQGGSIDDTIPLISPEHGLIGYPVFSNYGINFQCQYSDLILRGRKVQIETSLPNGSGFIRCSRQFTIFQLGLKALRGQPSSGHQSDSLQ